MIEFKLFLVNPPQGITEAEWQVYLHNIIVAGTANHYPDMQVGLSKGEFIESFSD